MARELPGYDVQLRLIPVQGEIGALIGQVTVQRTPFIVDLSAQNFGSSKSSLNGEANCIRTRLDS